MKIKILWLSRHSPLDVQVRFLHERFGDVTLIRDPEPFSSAEEIAKRVRDGGYKEIVVVAPMSVIARLVDLGIKPLWADMIQVSSQFEADVTVKNRHYRFNRFRRICALHFEFEEV